MNRATYTYFSDEELKQTIEATAVLKNLTSKFNILHSVATELLAARFVIKHAKEVLEHAPYAFEHLDGSVDIYDELINPPPTPKGESEKE